MIIINNKYPIKSFVRVLHDPDKLIRQVVGFELYADKTFVYKLACGNGTGYFHEYELEEVEEFERVYRNDP